MVNKTYKKLTVEEEDRLEESYSETRKRTYTREGLENDKLLYQAKLDKINSLLAECDKLSL